MVLLCPNEVLVSLISMSTVCSSDRSCRWTAIPSVAGGHSLPVKLSIMGETEVPDSGKERVPGAGSGRGQSGGGMGGDEGSKQVRQKKTGRKRGHPEMLHEGHSAAHRPWTLDSAPVTLQAHLHVSSWKASSCDLADLLP